MAEGGGPLRVAPWLIFTITATGVLNNTLINPVVPDILADLGQPDSRAGLLVAAGAVPGIVMAPVVGVLADRHGRRAVLVPSLIAFGLFGVASAAAPSFWVLVLLRMLQGVGAAGLLNLAVTLVSDGATGNARAKLLGRNGAVLTASIAVFPPIGGLLAEIGGWRASFAPYGIALVTAAVLARRLPARPPPVPVGGRLRGRDDLAAALRIARAPAVLVPIAMALLTFVLIFGAFLTALPVHLEDDFEIGAGARGLLLGIPAVTSTIVALSVGRLRARFGARRLLVAGWALFAVSFGVVAGAPTLLLLGLGAALYGYADGALIPTLQDLVAGAAPDEGRSAVISLLGSATRAGQTVGPLAAGVLIGGVSSVAPFVAGAVVAALVVAALLTCGRRLQFTGA